MNKFFIFCLIILLTSCQENILYHSFHPVNPTGWERNDTLKYTLTSSNLSTSHQLEVDIRHKDSYPYRDIWLSIQQNNHIDTLHIYLANEYGNWEGSGIGDVRQHTTLFPAFKVNAVDSICTLKITHIMEDKNLTGICDIGICLFKQP